MPNLTLPPTKLDTRSDFGGREKNKMNVQEVHTIERQNDTSIVALQSKASQKSTQKRQWAAFFFFKFNWRTGQKLGAKPHG